MISDYYTETVYVQKLSTGSTFGTIGTWSDSSTISAAMNPVTAAERFQGEKHSLFADYKMFCDADVTIDETRRVKWDSRSYDVVLVKDTLNKGHHLNVMLKRTDT
jgi:head-tail adaptor